MESGAANQPRGTTASTSAPRPEPRTHPRRKLKRRLSHENRILLLTLASGAVGIALAEYLIAVQPDAPAGLPPPTPTLVPLTFAARASHGRAAHPVTA